MRTIETTVFHYSELSESAKEKAIDQFRDDPDLFAWSDDWKQSIKAFCDHFGVTLRDWSVGPWSPIEYKHDAENRHFRGIKLSSVDRDYMPTGYCGDCDLWFTFHDEFKKTGNALGAFDTAIHKGFEGWRNDWEYAYSDDAIVELIQCNEYEFTAEGDLV